MIEPWVPIVTAIVAVLGGAFAYWNQKRIDRREALIQRRREAYRAFLETLFDHVEERTDATRRAFDRVKCDLLLVASDEVLKEMVNVQEAVTMDMVALGPLDVHQRVSELFKAMRKDCFEATNVDQFEFEYVVPIGKPTPMPGTR